MIECRLCGSQNNDGMNYCSYCGAPLSSETQNEEPIEAIPVTDEEMYPPTEVEHLSPNTEAMIIQQINAQKNANRDSNILFLKIYGTVSGGMLLIAILVGFISKGLGITMLVITLTGMAITLAFFVYRLIQQNNDIVNKTNDLEHRRGRIKVGNSILDFSDNDDEYRIHYSAMLEQLVGLGFTNVKAISLGDLRQGSIRYKKLNGYVSEVMAGNETINGNIWYDANTMIIVKYHGVRP